MLGTVKASPTYSFLKELDGRSLEELDALQNVRPLRDDVRRRQNHAHDLLGTFVRLQQVHQPDGHQKEKFRKERKSD